MSCFYQMRLPGGHRGYQAPKYGVTDTDRLPHRLPDFKSRRTIFRFVLDCIIGYLNRFGYLKIGFGYLKSVLVI